MAKKYRNRKNKIYLEIFPNLKTLTNITNLEKRFVDGQIIKIENPKENEYEFYIYKNGQILPMSEVEENDKKINLYDINKVFYEKVPQFDEGQINRAIDTINNYADNHKASHYLLLGNDIRYYTVLINDPNFFGIDTIGSAVVDCLENIGQIKEICEDEKTNSIECWVTTFEPVKETIVLYLFPYDDGVVRFGGY